MLRTERASRDCGVPPTASDLEAVFVPRIESGEENGGVKREVVNGPVLYKERKAYLLVRGIA